MNLLILHVKKSSNIFHSSVHGYECHSDGLQEILSKSTINFDVVCLSQTSQQSDHVFPTNGTLIALPLRSPPPPPPQVSVLCAAFGGYLPLIQ